MTRNRWIHTVVGAFCALRLLAPAAAGEFTVNPISIELGPAARSGVLGIRNDGSQRLSFQVEAMEWTQDAAGKDQYADTRDLVFFPKLLSVEPGQEGIIRVGIKNPIVQSEKTYRVFIEELPGAQIKPATPGAQINVLIRFGAPIFIAPVNPQDRLDIESLALAKGKLTFSARNTGNRHQLVQGIQLRGLDAHGKSVYTTTIADRYLLPGTVKHYESSIASDQCSRMATLELEVKTDKLTVNRKLDVSPAMCS